MATTETGTTTLGIASLPSLIFNPVSFLQMMDILQLVRYLKYIDIEYPAMVEKVFKILGTFDL